MTQLNGPEGMEDLSSPIPLGYLQRNNYYEPSKIDKVHIVEILRKPKADLEALDDMIALLQSKLVTIQEHKWDLDETICAYNQLLAPFRRLPDDVLKEIFIWCLPNGHNAVMDAREPPLLLGRVCSRWRSLVYATPSLWTTLNISSPAPPPERECLPLSSWIPAEVQEKLSVDFERQLQLHCDAVGDWLDRSRSLPLCISVELDEDGFSTRYPRQRDMYYMILTSCAHRWKSLEVYLQSWEHNFLTIIQPKHLPLLEFLHLRFPRRRRNTNNVRHWISTFISNAPKLHMMHLTQNSLRLSELGIDWTHITHLVLYETGVVRPDDAYLMFKACIRLQHCILEIVDGRGAPVHLSGDVSLPQLETFGIIDGANSFLEMFFETLDTPLLRNISYNTKFAPSSSRRSPLICLLRKNSCRIESLTIPFRSFTLADLVECFKHVPSLVHLKGAYLWPEIIRHPIQRRRTKTPFERKMMKTILDFLLPSDTSSTCLCPKLRTIHLKESPRVTDTDALNFLQRRLDCDGVERLTRVDITVEGALNLDVHARLQRYIDEGLQIEITASTLAHEDTNLPPPTKTSFNPYSGLPLNPVHHLTLW